MKALFVIYPDDPPEYFDQMAAIETRILRAGGSSIKETKTFTDWAKPPREYIEFVFECEGSMSVLVE